MPVNRDGQLAPFLSRCGWKEKDVHLLLASGYIKSTANVVIKQNVVAEAGGLL